MKLADGVLAVGPWDEAYVFAIENPSRSMVTHEVSEKAQTSLSRETPEAILEILKAALDSTQVRVGPEDSEHAVGWLHLRLHHDEKSNMRRALLQRYAHLLPWHAQIVTRSFRTVAELVALHGCDMDSWRAVGLILCWFELGNEVRTRR